MENDVVSDCAGQTGIRLESDWKSGMGHLSHDQFRRPHLNGKCACADNAARAADFNRACIPTVAYQTEHTLCSRERVLFGSCGVQREFSPLSITDEAVTTTPGPKTSVPATASVPVMVKLRTRSKPRCSESTAINALV